jgi:putative membrane protein
MSSRHIALSTLILGFIVLAVPRADSQEDTAAHDSVAQAILSTIHADNQANIQVGTLAQQQGASPQVRDLGKKLVDDHQSLDKKVLSLAEQKGVDLIRKPHSGATSGIAGIGETLATTAAISKLKALSGVQFDQAFASTVAKSSDGTIAQLGKAKASVKDSAIEQLIGEVLPTLHAHHEAAQSLSAPAAVPSAPAVPPAQ